MAQDSDLQALQDELTKLQSQTRRSRRWVAIGFGILILALVLSFLYAFVQSVEAERNAEEAFRQHEIAETAKIHADRNAEEARRQEALAHEAVKLAEVRLAECEKSKRK